MTCDIICVAAVDRLKFVKQGDQTSANWRIGRAWPRIESTDKLAAILVADVVGYSRMMAADEAGTLAALKQHRETLFDPAVVAHNGRIVKLMGDGVIVEFSSIVDAVNCALSVQRSGGSTSDAGAPRRSIVLRIGINLGDVIMEGDDIYGDGVNIAARLEPLAEPGGICVSSIVNESVGNRIDVRFTDAGDISRYRSTRIMRWPTIRSAAFIPFPDIRWMQFR